MADMNIRDRILMGQARVGIWGAGFIGGTTAMAYASEGAGVICYDVNPETVLEIKNGRLGVTNLEFWFGATIDEFVKKDLVHATHNWEDMRSGDIAAHFIAVPTEKDGEPWLDAIDDVIGKIKQCECRRVIIESTLIPGTVEKMNTEGLCISVAPRRDWFHSPEKNLKNLTRVFAGQDAETTNTTREILSIVCDNLRAASSIKAAELVKSLENSLLHVPAVYAMQLAHAYPDLDVSEVFDLAATHWRIPHYYPSFGTGGYCVPLSSKYVLMGAGNPEALTILSEVLSTDSKEPLFVAKKIEESARGGAVAIMGLSYKGDLKVAQLSPALAIADYLINKAGLQVSVHDPYFTHKEARKLLGDKVGWFEPEKGFSGFNALAIVTDHKAYKRIPVKFIIDNLDAGASIFDNYGIWKKYADKFAASAQKKIQYHHVGCEGWGNLHNK